MPSIVWLVPYSDPHELRLCMISFMKPGHSRFMSQEIDTDGLLSPKSSHLLIVIWGWFQVNVTVLLQQKSSLSSWITLCLTVCRFKFMSSCHEKLSRYSIIIYYVLGEGWAKALYIMEYRCSVQGIGCIRCIYQQNPISFLFSHGLIHGLCCSLTAYFLTSAYLQTSATFNKVIF